MTNYDYAQLQLATYNFAPDPHWDYWQDGKTDSDIVFGVKLYSTLTAAVVFRGSEIVPGVPFFQQDWVRDAEALPISVPGMGKVHPGFYQGMNQVWVFLKHKFPQVTYWILVGHSLGAGRTAMLAGIMKLDGVCPVLRVCWGEPRSGDAVLASLIGDGSIVTPSYRNTSTPITGEGDTLDPLYYLKPHDIVTDVPLTLGTIHYQHATTLINVDEPPPALIPNGDASFLDRVKELGAAWHSMILYGKAMEGMTS